MDGTSRVQSLLVKDHLDDGLFHDRPQVQIGDEWLRLHLVGQFVIQRVAKCAGQNVSASRGKCAQRNSDRVRASSSGRDRRHSSARGGSQRQQQVLSVLGDRGTSGIRHGEGSTEGLLSGISRDHRDTGPACTSTSSDFPENCVDENARPWLGISVPNRQRTPLHCAVRQAAFVRSGLVVILPQPRSGFRDAGFRDASVSPSGSRNPLP
jgi:hypothetical protein